MSVSINPLAAKLDSKDDVTVRLLTAFKSLISEGMLIPGSYLPAERELAEQFQVSRSSLRQALKVLQIMGVISQKVGHGTCINPEATSVLGEPMEFLVLLNGISCHELMEARVIVEPELAARAAVRASAEDLATLRREITEMRAPNVDGSLTRHDMRFHQAIFHAAGNRLCSMMFTVIHQSLQNLIEKTSRMVPVEHTSPMGSASPTRVKPPLPSGIAVLALVVHVLVAVGMQRPL